MATNQSSYRFAQADRDAIRELGRLWSRTAEPISDTAVIRECIRRALAAERATAAPANGKGGKKT